MKYIHSLNRLGNGPFPSHGIKTLKILNYNN